jgi:hypothetical protein
MAEQLTRRRFVMGALGAGTVLVVEQAPVVRVGSLLGATPAGAQATTTFRVVRAADQLNVLVELVRCGFDAAGTQIVPTGANPLIRLVFGPQHVAEQPFVDPPPPVPPTTAVAHVVAGDSQVVIPLTSDIPATLAGILARGAEALAVQSSAGPPSSGATVLELPYGVALSPNANTKLRAPAGRRTVRGVDELWVAELVRTNASPVKVRVVANLAAADLLGDRIPTAADRDQLVINTLTGGSAAPADARRLWLSSHGAFADIQGFWPGQPLERWAQRIVTGRDIHVETVSLGYLAPFGHRAALVTIAERRFLLDTGGGVTSVMVQQTYLELVESEVAYPGRGQRDSGRRLPFVNVRASLANEAPVTVVPLVQGGTDIPGAFEVRKGANPVTVDYVLTDRAANPEAAFSYDAWFIEDTSAHDPAAGASAARVVAKFNARGDRRVELGGAAVAFADELAPGGGATSKPTESITLLLGSPTGASTGQLDADSRPAFYPEMERARVVDVASDTVVEVTLHPRWLSSGTGGANFDQAYLTLAEPRTGELAAGSAARAVAGVDLTAEVFNQTSGAGLDYDSPDAPWNPEDALAETSKVLGNIVLSSVIGVIEDISAPGVSLPGTEVTVNGDTVTVVFSFSPPLDSREPTQTGFITNADSRADITITNVISLDGGDPESEIDIRLLDFSLEIPPGVPVVVLDFDEVRVVQPSDGPLQVTPDLSGWRFAGEFTWLDPVAEFFANISGDVAVEVRDGVLVVEVVINLPNVNLGVLRIRNASALMGVALPFNGDPMTVTAGVGSAMSPVQVTILGFEGSFYLTIAISGGPSVSTSIVAYAKISAELFGFDLVVVKATIGLALSALFKLDDGEVTFTASVAIEGEINVLGLVEVTVGVVGSVTYKSETEQLILSGRITWRVDSFLGGDSGSVPIGRTSFDLGSGAAREAGAGRAGTDPRVGAAVSFGDRYSEDDWTAYDRAFA